MSVSEEGLVLLVLAVREKAGVTLPAPDPVLLDFVLALWVWVSRPGGGVAVEDGVLPGGLLVLGVEPVGVDSLF